ncbi:MAG: hypothetical protein ACRDGS_05790, partial [Chloroflexota bacterium]
MPVPLQPPEGRPSHGLFWLSGAFGLSLLTVLALGWGVWWLALCAGVAALGALRTAQSPTPASTIFAVPPRGLMIGEGNRFLRPGLLTCTMAVFLAAWAGWYCYASPFITWLLVAYPLALIF